MPQTLPMSSHILEVVRVPFPHGWFIMLLLPQSIWSLLVKLGEQMGHAEKV